MFIEQTHKQANDPSTGTLDLLALQVGNIAVS